MALLIEEAAVQPIRRGEVVLSQGSPQEDATRLIQRALAALGAVVLADGDYGYRTQEAVRWFQHSVGLTADGAVGNYTLHALSDALENGGIDPPAAPRRDFRFLNAWDRFGRRVALTFDDGPHATNTAAILDILKDRGAPATFFVVGRSVQALPGLVARAAREGHAVGNHSWDHPDYRQLNGPQIADQLSRTWAAVEAALGRPAERLARAPYGSPFFTGSREQRERVKTQLIAGGYTHALWNIDTNDWRHVGRPDRILSELGRQLDPGTGGVLLMHDIHPQTVQALPELIDRVRAEGFDIVPLADLVAVKYGRAIS